MHPRPIYDRHRRRPAIVPVGIAGMECLKKSDTLRFAFARHIINFFQMPVANL